MLQRIRDKSSGPLAYAIVGLIALVFSVWGVGSYFTQSADPVVAQVGSTEITKFQLQRAHDQRYNRLQQVLGDNFDRSAIDAAQFRRSVLTGLIEQAVLTQYAEQVGYRVTDEALIGALRDEPRFLVDGQFSPQRYRSLLSQAGITASAFEAGLRNDLQLQQVRQSVFDTAFVGEREIARAVALQNQRRRAATLLFEPAAFRDRVKIDDAEIEAYYRDNPTAFMQEQRVKLNYVVLERGALEIPDPATEADLKALYEQAETARFKSPARRRARQILVRINAETSADAARERIQQLAGELESGAATFAELAREHSDDEESAESGGELGWITQGSMAAPFEQALFALEPDAVSNPVKTGAGWHLIKLEAVEEAKTKAFDDPDVQKELRSLYRHQVRKDRYRQQSERLDALSFEAPESLQPIAEALGLEVQASDWITRAGGGSGVAGDDAVVQAAFSNSVLKDGLNSTPIQLSGDRQAVVRIAESQPAQRQPLEAVRADIRKSLVGQEAGRLAREAAWQALERARGGTKLTAIAEDSPATLMPAQWITRSGDQLAPSLRDKLFMLPRPKANVVSYGTATTADGVSALLALQEVETPEIEPSARERIAQSLRQRVAGIEFAAFRQSVRDDFDVEIYEQRLN